MDIQNVIIADAGHSSHLLLPFTHGVHTQALEYAVLLARSRQATLVPFSMIPVSSNSTGPRLEKIQQSKDFQVLVQSKAARHGVAIEAREIYSTDVVESMHRVMQELHCSGSILFVCNGNGVLLSTHEVKHILTLVPGQHHVIRLQSNARRFSLNTLKNTFGVLSRHRVEPLISNTGIS